MTVTGGANVGFLATGGNTDVNSLRVDADVVVVEIKAAAIDVVAEEAERRGIEVILAGNDVVVTAGITPGARVVVEGTLKLRPGQPVNPVPFAEGTAQNTGPGGTP